MFTAKRNHVHQNRKNIKYAWIPFVRKFAPTPVSQTFLAPPTVRAPTRAHTVAAKLCVCREAPVGRQQRRRCALSHPHEKSQLSSAGQSPPTSRAHNIHYSRCDYFLEQKIFWIKMHLIEIMTQPLLKLPSVVIHCFWPIPRYNICIINIRIDMTQ